MTFDKLGLSAELLDAVRAAGYEQPTPIQQQAIPAVLEGRDVLGIAQTGTGKTASFTLPMIERLSRGRARARMPRSLILTPTRELAVQVADNFEKYGKNHRLAMALLIGGVAFDEQDRKLDRGVDVLIATPGRLLDQFERGKVLLTGVQILVVDEADRMLDMGFIPDIEKIFKLTPFTRQTLFFSATMPTEIARITNTFLQNPVRIEVTPPSTTVTSVKQYVVAVSSEFKAKRESLRRLLRADDVTNAIIFCNRKRDVAILARSLEKHGFEAEALHGDLDQSKRLETLDNFRSGRCKFLVASDVAARGLDIPAVSHIFNFDAPHAAEDYVHRIGRTGRAGRSGVAISLMSKADSKARKAIEREIGQALEDYPGDELKALREETDSVRAQPEKESGKNKRGARARPDKAGADRKRGKSRASVEKSSGEPPAAASKPADASGKKEKAEGKGKKSEQVVGLGDHIPAFLTREVPHIHSNADKEMA